MANELRVAGSLSALQDVGVEAGTLGGQAYTCLQHDGNAASRAWGGKYNSLTAYTDGDIAGYISKVVGQTAQTALTGHAWCEGTALTYGTLPTTCHAIVVEYISELGTVGDVTVSIKQAAETELTIASLDLGEALVLPIHEGLPIAEIYIGCDAYSNGTNEATVNVLVVGV